MRAKTWAVCMCILPSACQHSLFFAKRRKIVIYRLKRFNYGSLPRKAWCCINFDPSTHLKEYSKLFFRRQFTPENELYHRRQWREERFGNERKRGEMGRIQCGIRSNRTRRSRNTNSFVESLQRWSGVTVSIEDQSTVWRRPSSSANTIQGSFGQCSLLVQAVNAAGMNYSSPSCNFLTHCKWAYILQETHSESCTVGSVTRT